MKKTFTTLLLASALIFCLSSFTADDGGRKKIYLENKCGSSVKVEVKSPGQGTSYTISAGYKKPFSFLEDAKVYVDGKLICDVASASEGSSYVVCE